MLDGTHVRVIYGIPARHRLRVAADVGSTFPLHCSAKGRAILAAYPPGVAERMLPDALERFTDKTVTPNIITGGVGTYEQGNRSLNNQYQVKSTNIFAGHQVKYGIEYYDAVYSQVNQLTGPTFKAADGRQTATGARVDIIPGAEVPGGKVYRVTQDGKVEVYFDRRTSTSGRSQ